MSTAIQKAPAAEVSFADLDVMLSHIDFALRKTILTAGIRAAAKPIVKLARAHARKQFQSGKRGIQRTSTGALERSIALKNLKLRPRLRRVDATIGPDSRFWRALGGVAYGLNAIMKNSSLARGVATHGKRRTPTRYAHLLEFGTRHRRARPFLRPALDEGLDAARSAYVAAAQKQIDRILDKRKSLTAARRGQLGRARLLLNIRARQTGITP